MTFYVHSIWFAHTVQCNVVIVARTIFYCCKLRVNKKGVKIEANIYSLLLLEALDPHAGESDSSPTTGFGSAIADV